MSAQGPDGLLHPGQGEYTPPRPHEVFPVSKAAHLDSRFRWYLYRPDRLALRYVRPGDLVLDFGCGPGFFTREFARRVGDGGTVIAVDLQEEMLRILRGKMEREGLLPRVRTHQCRKDAIGAPEDLLGTVDAAFAIFVVHEVPDPRNLFREIAALLKPGGRFFYTEPVIEVPGKQWEANLVMAGEAGLAVFERRWYFLNRAALLEKRVS